MAIRNPYPGLRPFEESDAHLFFGRAAAVGELLGLLGKHRFLAVLGVSGSGKSSLVRAGLLPAMHLGAMGDEFADWRVAAFQPGMDPIGALSAALDDPDVLGPNPEGRAVLERSTRGLAERALRASLADGSYLLVFVDQFEEIFRFKKERPQGSNDATLFVQLLLEAARQEWSRVHVLITMRSDFLGECSQFSGLPEALGKCQYLVRGMTSDQRMEAIEQPARVARIEITARLVQQVLNDAGDDPAQLPVLQHALMRTCEEGAPGPLEVEHYDAAGTMAHSLDWHAQRIFDGLGEPDQRAARRMFRCLAERRAGARDTRRPTTVKKLAGVAGVSEKRIERIYRHFSGGSKTFLTCRNPRVSPILPGRRLRDAEGLTSTSLIDVSHESLLHLWKTLNQWIDWEEDLGRRFTTLAEGLLQHPDDLLQGNSLDRAREWLQNVQEDLPDELSDAQKLSALSAWAERYPVRHGEVETPVAFARVKELIDRSEAVAAEAARRRESQERRQRYLYQAVGLLLIVAGVAGAAYWRMILNNKRLAEVNGRLTSLTGALTVETRERTEAATLAGRREQEALKAREESERLRQVALQQRDAEAKAKLAVTMANAKTEKAFTTTKVALADAEQARADALTARKQAEEERSEALAARDQADQARRSALSRLFFARSEALRTQRASLLPVSVAVGLVGIRYSNSDPELLKQAGEAWLRALTLLPIQAGQIPLPPAERPVAFAFSPKGDLLATLGQTDRASTLRVWTVQGRQLNAVSVDTAASDLTFSPDARYLAALTPKAAIIWNLSETGVRYAPHTDTVNTLAFANGSKTFATGSDDGNACIWKSENAERVRCMRHPGEEYVTTLDFSPDDQRLVTGTDENWVRVWHAGTGQRLVEMHRTTDKVERPSHDDRVNAVRFSPAQGRTVASASSDRTVRLWDAATGRPVALLNHPGLVLRVEFSRDARLLASAGSDNTGRVWTTATGRQVAALAHENRITAITFSPDSRHVATAAADNTGRVWDAGRGTETWRAVHDGTVLGIRFSGDGKYFATASADRTARVWEIPDRGGLKVIDAGAAAAAFGGPDMIAALGTDRALRILDVSQSTTDQTLAGPFDRFAFSEDGRWVAANSSKRDGNEISIVRPGSNQPPVTIPGKPTVQAMALDAQGRYLAVGSLRSATIWDIQNRRELPYQLVHSGPVLSLAFSPDGAQVATGSRDGTASVWDVATGTRLATLRHDLAEFVIAVAFNSDGSQLATGSDETLAHLWDWRQERELKRFRHGDDVVALAFDRGGRRLATASDDNAARVWNIESGAEERRFALASPGRAVKFSADGMRLNTVSLNGAFGSWSLPTADLVAEACSRLPRELTKEEWREYIGDDLRHEAICPTQRRAGGS